MAYRNAYAEERRRRQYDGTESPAINNTLLRRLFFLDTHHATTLLRPRRQYGPFSHLQEAATMRFVAEQAPGVPIPKVHCAFVHKIRAYIVMERIRGESLGCARARLATDEPARANIMTQLRPIFDELRRLKPPPGAGVQSCTGGSLYDSNIPHATPRFGQFPTIQEFHIFLRKGLQPNGHPHRQENQAWREIDEMVEMQDGPWAPPVFTHGDLKESNILVRGDEVVGIIDWEFAGWNPIYWEYTNAWTVAIMRKHWQQALGEFLELQPNALKVEITRQTNWVSFTRSHL